MKKRPSPQNQQSSQRRQRSDFQNEQTPNSTNKHHQQSTSAFNYIRGAAKRVTGFLKTIFIRPKRATSEAARTASRVGNSNRIREISFSTDFSTYSNTRSSSKLKSFGSYGSSSVSSGQFGTERFSIEDIYKATDNFSAANKIGEGGFGKVYKGKLREGYLVAIKRAKKITHDKCLISEFKNEIRTLSLIEHLNLVKLHGYVEHGDERIILVEYVGNGTLREHLDGKRGDVLEIAERLDIAIDVAHAITYLHTYNDPPIIHRDIKASNILITEKLRAKVADFGFARLVAEDPDATHVSTLIKGTTGYFDPEYVRTFQLTEKSDVYSFGVLLVELVSGRHPIEQNMPLSERITTRWAMHKLKGGESVVAMDPRLKRTPASTMVVEKILKLARQCLAPSRQSRPSMKKCAEVLWCIRKDYKDIAFSTSSTSHQSASANFPHRNARKNRFESFGIDDDEDYKFVSAQASSCVK